MYPEESLRVNIKENEILFLSSLPFFLSLSDDVVIGPLQLTKINSDNASEEEGLMGNSSEEGSSSSSSAEQKGPQLSQQNHQMVKLNVSELEKEFGFLKWSKVFNYLEEQTSIRITEILTDSKDYLNEVSQLFARHSLQTIDNYFCWAYVARFLPYLGPQFRRLYTDFRREMPDLTGSTNDPRSEGGRVFLSRWKECVHLTCEGLKLPSSLLYLSHHEGFMQEANRSVSLMIRNIKNAFHHIIRSQKWLKSEVIQRMLIEKAEAIGSKIGFPSFLSSDPKTADSLFSGLEIESSDVFVSNIIKIARNEMRMELRKMNQTIDPDKDWLIQPLVSNAYFDAINDFISENTLLSLSPFPYNITHDMQVTYISHSPHSTSGWHLEISSGRNKQTQVSITPAVIIVTNPQILSNNKVIIDHPSGRNERIPIIATIIIIITIEPLHFPLSPSLSLQIFRLRDTRCGDRS